MEIGSDLVCVTGASGFIGTHVIRELLERGHRVRGTVRDPDDIRKVAHLKTLPGAAERLELVGGDLMKPGSFDAAMQGVVGVVHTAAAVTLAAPNPYEDIVRPSVEGTANVLGAIQKTGSVRHFVHTSSVAAVNSTPEKGRIYTEEDWAEASLKDDPYGLAKLQAEEMVVGHAKAKGYRMVSINPSLVLGPVYWKGHSKGSPGVVRDHLIGTFPACPQMFFGVVDVREVASAMARALVDDSVSGRFILSAEGLWMQEMARQVKALFPKSKARTGKLPNLLFYAAALFDKRLSLPVVRRMAGKDVLYDNTRSRSLLGVEYRPLRQSIQDTCRSLMEQGFAPPLA